MTFKEAKTHVEEILAFIEPAASLQARNWKAALVVLLEYAERGEEESG